MYAELSYFEGAHFAHIAAWEERQRLARIARESRRVVLGLRWAA